MKRSSCEQVSPPVTNELPDPAKLGRHLIRTMYYSFAVTQGRDQDVLLSAAAGVYRSQYPKDLLTNAIDTVNKDTTGNLKLPHNHRPSGEEVAAVPYDPERLPVRHDPSSQFRYNWGVLARHVNDRRWASEPYDPALLATQTDLAVISEELARVDHRYLSDEHGRRIGKPGDDPRKSFIREHVIGGETVKDPVLDDIVGDVRHVLLGGELSRGAADIRDKTYGLLPEIVSGWEFHHSDSGEQFAAPGTFSGVLLPVGVIPTPEFERLR